MTAGRMVQLLVPMLASIAMGCAHARVARLEACRPLLYRDGADPATDRPAHVRAASGITPFAGGLAVVQDDARFVAMLRDDGVHALPLPADAAGRRLHDDTRGTRDQKLDVEASVVVDAVGGPVLLGFGSGASPAREVIVVVRDGQAAEVRDAAALYRALRAERTFAGSELNVEGAVAVGEAIRLFQRGNGAAREGEPAVNATLDLDRRELLRWLAGEGPVPAPRAATRFDLGRAGEVRYGFADATVHRGRVTAVAVAEGSPDVLRDGPVAGVRVGRWEGHAFAWVPVVEPDGSPTTRKIEGISADPDASHRLWAVTDADDPSRAAEVCALDVVDAW